VTKNNKTRFFYVLYSDKIWVFDQSERAQGHIYIIKESVIWLAPWAGKMNQILCCDWLSERARWSYLVRSGLPAVSRKQNFPESHIINPVLTKLVRPRWLDIGLVLFLRVYVCVFMANIQPSWPHTWSITHIYFKRISRLKFAKFF